MRKEKFRKVNPIWTIWIPLFCGIFILGILLVLLFFSTTRGSLGLSHFSAIAMIIIIFPAILIGLLVFIIIVFMIRGLTQVSIKMPVWLLNTDSFLKKWFDRIDIFSEWSIRPFIFLNLIVKRLQIMMNSITKVSRSK